MDSDDLFFELYRNLPRQGPGDNESTRQAFALCTDLPSRISILDVGCGSGMQTIQLAKLINGHVTAIDFHQPYLNQLEADAENQGLSDKITVLNKSMFDMDFPDGSFDMIWSEGAIYIYGFRNALNDWKRLLKPDGYMVCSHIVWLKDDPPEEISSYWEREYPEITGVVENLNTIRNAGYTIIDHFPLPSESWWKEYYNPLKQRLDTIHQKYRSKSVVTKLVNATRQEINLFKRYSEYYGYAFFVMKRRQDG